MKIGLLVVQKSASLTIGCVDWINGEIPTVILHNLKTENTISQKKQ